MEVVVMVWQAMCLVLRRGCLGLRRGSVVVRVTVPGAAL